MDPDVVIVGAGPVGLMLAGELCLAGVRPADTGAPAAAARDPEGPRLQRADRGTAALAGPAGPDRSGQLIRLDAHIAWAAATGEPAGTAVPALRGALSRWFGLPRPAQNRPGVLERG